MKQTVKLWAIQRNHPRSTSIDPNVLGNTKREALDNHRATYVRVWADSPTPNAGAELWDRNFAAGLFRAVRVEVSWEDGR